VRSRLWGSGPAPISDRQRLTASIAQRVR